MRVKTRDIKSTRGTLRMHLWWSMCTLYLLGYQVRVSARSLLWLLLVAFMSDILRSRADSLRSSVHKVYRLLLKQNTALLLKQNIAVSQHMRAQGIYLLSLAQNSAVLRHKHAQSMLTSPHLEYCSSITQAFTRYISTFTRSECCSSSTQACTKYTYFSSLRILQFIEGGVRKVYLLSPNSEYCSSMTQACTRYTYFHSLRICSSSTQACTKYTYFS